MINHHDDTPFVTARGRQPGLTLRSAALLMLLPLSACQSLIPESGREQTARHPSPSHQGHLIPAPKRPAIRPEARERQVAARQDNVIDPGADDLWDRVRDGMTLDHALTESEVLKELRWFSRHQEYLDRCAGRAALYLHHVTEEIEARGMPMEIALLPIVESAFNPYAVSRSNAVGMWQFIGSTGKVYGLRQDWWYDGRRDVLESTRAALDYLEKLHGQFDDWMLALAAYNSGEGRVARAVASNRRKGLPTDFWSLSLPRETSAYVPKLLALSRLVKAPEEHGVHWLPIDNQPAFEVVETGRPVALAEIARLAGITMDELYHLNPGYTRWATPPKGPHRVVVPGDSAEDVRSGLDTLPEVKALSWQQYEVERGDTLSGIAQQFSVSTAALRSSNSLNGNLIKPGQQLTIPVAGVDTASSGIPANNPFVRTVKKRKRHKAVTTYTVRGGDSLWTISRRYQVSVPELARWNGLKSSQILRPGQKIRIRKVSSNAGRAGSSQASGKRRMRYQVRGGDSLWTIARRFQVRVADIRNWNALHSKRYLKPGQQLTLFVD